MSLPEPTQRPKNLLPQPSLSDNEGVHPSTEEYLPDPHAFAEAIVDTIPDALLVLRTDLRIRIANQAFYKMFRVQPDQTEGMYVYELGNGQWDIAELRILLEEILPKDNSFTGYEVDHEFDNIGRRIMRLNGRRLEHAQLILLVITDVTEQMQAETSLRRNVQIERFRSALGDALHPLVDPVEVQAVASRMLGEHLNVNRVHYAEVAEDGEYGIVRADYCLGVPSVVGQHRFDEYGPVLMQEFRAGRTLVVTNVQEDARIHTPGKAATAALHIGAYVLVPLMKGEQPVAVLVVHSLQPRAWTQEEVSLVEEIAQRTWEAVERALAETALRRNEERYTFLVRLGDAKRALHDAEAIKATASHILGEHLRADQVEYIELAVNLQTAVRRTDKTGDYTTGIVEPPGGVPFSPWIVDELRANRPVVVDDVEKLVGVAASDRAMFGARPCRAFVYFPVVQKDQLVAALAVYHAHPRHWTEDELALIQETAERTCSSIERAHAVTALHVTTARLRLAQDASGVGTFEWDIQNNVNHWSPELERLYNLPLGSFGGTYEDWAALVHPDDLPEAERMVQLALASGRLSAEWRVVRNDGETMWLLARGWVEKDAQGQPVRMIGANVDITWRKQAEMALRASEQRYRMLFNSIDESFSVIELIYDAEGKPVDFRYVETNPAFEHVTGLRNAVGKTALELVPDLDRHWIETFDNVATTGASQRFTREGQTTGRWYETYAFPIGDPAERRVALLSQDITAQKQAEQRLRQLNDVLEQRVNERTRQVRKLATELTISEQAERRRISQILHDDLQQHIFGLQFQLKFVRDALLAGRVTAANSKLDEINDAILNLVSLTRSLSVDLSPPVLHNEGLTEAVRWLATQMKQQHGLKVNVQRTGDVPIPGEDLRVLLFQIVRELLFNVVKHAGVDEATVALSRVDASIQVEVSDLGRGFDIESVLSDPQHSHGLLHNQQRLTLMGGHMRFESTVHKGTCITIVCPVSA